MCVCVWVCVCVWGGGYSTFLLSQITDFLFLVFDKLLFMYHLYSTGILSLSLLNSIVRCNMFHNSRSSRILKWTRRASLTFPLGKHQMIHKSTAPGLYG